MNAGSFTYLLFVISLVLFGTNGVVADGIHLPSTQIVVLRTFFGGLLLTALLFLTRKRPRYPKQRVQMLYLLISGISMGVSWIFLYEAYVLIGVGMASMAYYCGPVLVMALSPFVFNEKLSSKGLLGFIVVVFGAILLCIEAVGDGSDLLGYVYGFASAIAHAAMVVFSKLSKDIDGLENSSFQLVFSFITVFVYALLTDDIPDSIPTGDWPYVLFLGFISTGMGCFIYFSTITRLRAQTVSITGYLEPLSAVIFAALLLGEVMTPLQITGAVAILLGALYAETHLGKKRSENGTSAQ